MTKKIRIRGKIADIESKGSFSKATIELTQESLMEQWQEQGKPTGAFPDQYCEEEATK